MCGCITESCLRKPHVAYGIKRQIQRVICAEENHKRYTLYTETESKKVMQNVPGLFTDVCWLGLGPFMLAKQVRAESTQKGVS